MSWFDATGLANIAKTALKEAQKTIDKALDIRDDEDVEEEIKSSSKENILSKGSNEKDIDTSSNIESSKNVLKTSEMPTSTWGSFSGSFFQVDNSKKSNEKSVLISTQPQKLSLLLPDESEKVPLAKAETELTQVDSPSKNKKNEGGEKRNEEISLKASIAPKDSEAIKCIEKGIGEPVILHNELQNVHFRSGDVSGNVLVDEKVITRQKAKKNSSNRNSYVANRLSVLSTDSEGKRSSESVEVLGSLSCTTSPDTDLPSISASSSLGLPISSSCTDSVELIDSLTSPSSIEVLVEGSGSGRTTQSSLVNSPKDDTLVNQNKKTLTMVSSPVSSGKDVSPESFEVIPDLPEYDEELSIGDSYTSASESTGATVLDHSYQYSYRMTESFPDLSQASSKFRSGDSTPDVITKFPLISRNSCDIPSGFIPEKSVESSHSKSAELVKSLIESEKQSQKNVTTDDLTESSSDIEKTRPARGSPTGKLMVKSDCPAEPDDSKLEKLDSLKIESRKNQVVCSKKDFEEKEPCVQGSEKSELFPAEEISGSVSSFSDTRTIVANDSSCDEIVLESSSEDVGNLSGSRDSSHYKTVDRTEGDGTHSHAYYVKSLLSEAMREMSTTRETSPTLSEKSRSDLIKVGSEQTSGHTSGDELETTTSSDIEIISRYSPNGDSSSTASRHSPAKLLHHNSKSKLSLVAVDILGKATHSKNKGHHREPSDGSSFCSEDNFSEVEKLSKRVTELTEILEARESRLNDLRKMNLELQEKNQELKREMEQIKKTASTGLPSSQTESEKDELIKELKEEGEKLSKKELKQTNLIKTLRAHEKSQQAIIDSNKTQIQNLTKTVDELRAELASKKSSEKSLNDKVKQMNKKITRQDEEIANLLNQMEKAVVKAEEFRILLDAKETELVKCKELLAAEDFELQDAKSIADSKTKQLERLKAFQESAEIKLEDMTQQLKKAEEMHSERERHHREEKNELMRRLQEAEGRNEELAQSVSKATRPLLRQMEALQATTAHERETWEKQEKILHQKLEEAENRLSSTLYLEKGFKQETLSLRTKIECLEEQLEASNKEITTWKNQVNSLTRQLNEAKNQSESEKAEWEKQQDNLRLQINSLKGEVMSLEQQISNERASAEAERRKLTLQEQAKERDGLQGLRDSTSPRSSPTLSFGRVSLSESLSSNVWPQFGEDGFETGSVSGRCSNVYENLRVGNTASLIENLQAQLKMRDGEISQLQWELQRRDAERSTLTSELSSLTSKLEEREKGLEELKEADKNLKELQTKYEALLEMFGEKVEEVDELRLDLQDVKEMYKSQIDQLLKKEKRDVSGE